MQIKSLKEVFNNSRIKALPSVCSSNEYVIEVAMERAQKENMPVLIEATANQVNQYGGYSGMTPENFRDYIYEIASRVGFDKRNIILGGDHLGPLVWSDQDEDEAMREASDLISLYVKAGFKKIHIDTSMRLKNDGEKLSDDIIAIRAAKLTKVIQKTCEDNGIDLPDIIIGSEVPTPGGVQFGQDVHTVTKVNDFKNTMDTFIQVFNSEGLSSLLKHVVGVVVQIGVEFEDKTVMQFNEEPAKELSSVLCDYPGIFFEAHSTDYQPKTTLRKITNCGVRILKVGPALTFALREALYALEMIEVEMYKAHPNTILSNFKAVLNKTMLEDKKYWVKHYCGNEFDINFSLNYSLLDRSRYYFNNEQVKSSIDVLMKNVSSVDIPDSLLSQYMSCQYEKVLEGILDKTPLSLIKSRINDRLEHYYFACKE